MHPTAVALAALLILLLAVPSAAEEGAPSDPVEKALASPQATGLLVTEVAPETQAAKLGIEPGDVIVTYDGHPTPSIAALQAVMKTVTAEAIKVLVIRADGAEKTFTLEPGRIGVVLAAVVEGKGVKPLPPATDVKFDFSSLADAPHDDWYAFAIGGKRVGFEHGVNTLEDGKLVMRREVAFDGGEQWGVNHFDVTVVLTAESLPKLLSARFENPIHGYVGTGVPVKDDAGRTAIRYTHNGEGEEQTAEYPVPGDLPAIPSYVVETLACFMPREKGACFHYHSISEGSGTIDRLPSALRIEGEEEVEIAGAAVKTVKVQIHTSRGGPGTAFWVNEAGRVVKADYMGAVTLAAKKEDCLQDLHHGLQPRTAD